LSGGEGLLVDTLLALNGKVWLMHVKMPRCSSKSIPAGQPEGYILAYSKTALMESANNIH